MLPALLLPSLPLLPRPTKRLLPEVLPGVTELEVLAEREATPNEVHGVVAVADVEAAVVEMTAMRKKAALEVQVVLAKQEVRVAAAVAVPAAEEEEEVGVTEGQRLVHPPRRTLPKPLRKAVKSTYIRTRIP